MPSKPNIITLTESDLTALEQDLLTCWLSARRAADKAKEVLALEALQTEVIKLVKTKPNLLFDGARIQLGTRTSWEYTTDETVAAALALTAAEKRERLSGAAVKKTVEFPRVSALSKWAGQAVLPEATVLQRVMKALGGRKGA